MLAVVFPDGAYAGRADGTETAAQKAMLKSCARLTTLSEFLTLYENGVEIDGISIFPDSRVLAFANGVYFLGSIWDCSGVSTCRAQPSSVSKFYPARKFPLQSGNSFCVRVSGQKNEPQKRQKNPLWPAEIICGPFCRKPCKELPGQFV